MDLKKYLNQLLNNDSNSQTDKKKPDILWQWSGHFSYTPDNVSHRIYIRKLRTSTDRKLYGVAKGDKTIEKSNIERYKRISGKEEDTRVWKRFCSGECTHYVYFGYRVANKTTGMAVRSIVDDSYNFNLNGFDPDALAVFTSEWILDTANNLKKNQVDFLFSNELSRQFWAKMIYAKFKGILDKYEGK